MTLALHKYFIASPVVSITGTFLGIMSNLLRGTMFMQIQFNILFACRNANTWLPKAVSHLCRFELPISNYGFWPHKGKRTKQY